MDICKENNIKCQSIKKADSGFTNIVYIVNDEYIVKVINTFTKPEKLQKEIDFYKNIKIDAMPKYVSSGIILDKDYLIIKKLNGKSLYTVWHTLNEQKRKDVLIQIANIFDAFHKQKGDFLAEKFIQTDWILKTQNLIKFLKKISLVLFIMMGILITFCMIMVRCILQTLTGYYIAQKIMNL